ncbi:MAG: hypothetical protein ACQETX_11550 [Pseudomonadota bacterium]
MDFTTPLPSFNQVLPECSYRYRNLEGASFTIGECTNSSNQHVVNRDITDHVTRVRYHFGTADILIHGRTSSDYSTEESLLPFDFDDTLEHILQTATNGLSKSQRDNGFLKLMFGTASQSKRRPRYRLKASIGGIENPDDDEPVISLKGREMLASRCYEIYMKKHITWFHASGIELLVLSYSLANAENRHPDIERGFIEMYQSAYGQQDMHNHVGIASV